MPNNPLQQAIAKRGKIPADGSLEGIVPPSNLGTPSLGPTPGYLKEDSTYGAAVPNANSITNAMLRDSVATSVIGRSAGTAGDPADIQATADGQVLTRAGGVLVWRAAAGGASATEIEVDLGATAVTCGRFTITDASIGATSKVLCWQAPGPYTGKGTLGDEAMMQPVSVIAVMPAAGSAVVYWETPPLVSLEVIPWCDGLRESVSNSYPAALNRLLPLQILPKRLGRVRGNVKFQYMILA